MKKVLKNPKHIICILITLAFAVISDVLFWKSWLRLIEAFRDFGLSFVYAYGLDVPQTVNKMSNVELYDLGILPDNLDTFAIKLKLYGKLLITGTSFTYYSYFLSNTLSKLSYVLLFLLPFIGAFIGVTLVLVFKKNNDYNEDTKPLKVFKKISEYTYEPAKRNLKRFFGFVREKRYYWITWVVIWCFSFNLPTILIEVCAYYFYYVATFDTVNLYIQAIKLCGDLSIVISFFPPWCWVIIALIVYDIWRRHHAYKKLEKIEEDSEDFCREMSVSNMIVAPMNMKKTTFMTDVSITFNKVFRDTAYDKLIENDLKFPNFPWINLELCIKRGMEQHHIYNLATCKMFTDTVRKVYYLGQKQLQYNGNIQNVLKQKYGYNYDNYLFDYDADRYGFTYYDKLETKTIFDVIETYTKLYFIYVITCNMLLSSYSIRTDELLKDKGNFPIWDIDFFRRDDKFFAKHSRYSHILDYDALRLGKKVCESSEFKDSIDFGIIVITEVGKERGNQKTQKGGAKDTEANQNNDLFNIDVKMCRHRATVDNFPFVVFLTDEQRAESLNADEREVGDVLNIKESSDFKMVTPLFALDELIYIGATKWFKKFYKTDRYNKGNNTLLRYIIKSMYGVIEQHYTNIFNTFSVSTLKISGMDGKLEDKGKAIKYKLPKKKIHAARFSTDAYAGFYYEKTKRSLKGIVDIPEYKGKTATLEELNQQHSYFVENITEAFIKNKNGNVVPIKLGYMVSGADSVRGVSINSICA